MGKLRAEVVLPEGAETFPAGIACWFYACWFPAGSARKSLTSDAKSYMIRRQQNGMVQRVRYKRIWREPSIYAGMAELADAPDLGSGGRPCRFESCCPQENSHCISWKGGMCGGFLFNKKLRFLLNKNAPQGGALRAKENGCWRSRAPARVCAVEIRVFDAAKPSGAGVL